MGDAKLIQAELDCMFMALSACKAEMDVLQKRADFLQNRLLQHLMDTEAARKPRRRKADVVLFPGA